MFSLLLSLALTTGAQAKSSAETSLGKIIAKDLAKRRGMVALDVGGTGGAVIGARYAAPVCRSDFEKAVLKGRPVAFTLADSARPLDEKIMQVSEEETYKLDRQFSTRNKADISDLAKQLGIKASAAADLIRRSNISFKVYRKSYPAFRMPVQTKIGPKEEEALSQMAIAASTVSTPNEVLFVSGLTFEKVTAAELGFSAGLPGKEPILDAKLTRDTTGRITLPDNAAVAFKPLILWEAARCRR